MTYYIGYMDNNIFHVLATSKDNGAAIFIVRAYNKYSRECCNCKYKYTVLCRGELPEHWVYEKGGN
jgi:hypothetical protein